LAANVLNAVGGAPALDDPEWVPTYPRRLLPNGKGPEVRLRRFTPEGRPCGWSARSRTQSSICSAANHQIQA
jgi:hypothetical protein